MRKQKPRRVRYTPETNTGKRPRTGDHGMDSENGQTKGHNNHDQTAQRKHAGSRVGKRKRMGHHTLEDKHTPVRSAKRATQQTQEASAERRRRKRRNQRKQPNENAERNSEKAPAGRERRMAQTFEQPSGRLPMQNVEDKERR